MPSLLERAKGLFGFKKPEAPADPQQRLFNPLRARIGMNLRIDSPDYLGQEFTIRELLEYGFGKDEKVSCYVATSNAGDGSSIRLRLQPDDGRMQAVVCRLFDELDEEPGIVSAVNDRGGLFVIETGDPPVKEQYARIDDLRVVRKAVVSRLSDIDGDGEISPHELESWTADCWDYSRRTTNHGVAVLEYLFAERTKLREDQKPRFRLWRGLSVLPERISTD